jgi:hypothetical protein
MSPGPPRLFALPTFVIAVLLLSSAPDAVAGPISAGTDQGIAGPAILEDVAALSADSMGGRAPGTDGDRMAQAYLARRLERIGFQPGAAGGAWEQPITFVGLTVQGFDRWRSRAWTRSPRGTPTQGVARLACVVILPRRCL